MDELSEVERQFVSLQFTVAEVAVLGLALAMVSSSKSPLPSWVNKLMKQANRRISVQVATFSGKHLEALHNVTDRIYP